MLNLLNRQPDHGFDEPIGLLTDCHRRIEKFLAVLKKVASQAPEPLDDRYRQGLETALDYFEIAAPKHTEDVELSLFPRLGANAQGRAALSGLEEDH